jgi:DNA repair protein SbcD/Mre11
VRFIHTGDWHLGKLLRERQLLEDQEFALHGLLRLVEQLRPDAMVVAGDVYDRAVAPVEAVAVLDEILATLTLDLRVPVVMIAGNHDSARRLQYLNGLVRGVGLHVVGEVGAAPAGVRVAGADGVEVVFWPLAYTDPETARGALGRADIHTHEAALRAQLDLVREQMGDDARHVVVAHAFVTGATTSESERPLSVGGSGEVSRDLFDGFDYAALGHLHRPQRVGERVRYAGSLLKYSFDEADHRKSVTVVDVDAAGGLTIEQIELPVLRDLVRLKGSFDELLTRPDAADYAQAYVEVVLTDTDAVLDPMQKLRAVYPEILSLRREAWLTEGGVAPAPDVGRLSTRDLFAEFFEETTGGTLTEPQQQEVDAALTASGREEREASS